jgi:putative flippase GtrA
MMFYRAVRSMPRLEQLASYGAVSAVALGIDVATLVGLKELAGINYVVASAAGMLTGTLVHYALAKVFVFGEGRLKAKGAEFLAYAVLGGIAMGASVVAIVALTEWGGLDYRVSKALSVVLSFFVGYALRKSLLFGTGLKAAPAPTLSAASA